MDSPSVCAVSPGLSRFNPTEDSSLGLIQLESAPGESGELLAKRLVQTLIDGDLIPVLTLAFGNLGEEACFSRALRAQSALALWPVQWVQGAPCGGGELVGLQTYVLPRSKAQCVRHLVAGERVLGTAFEDDKALHLVLGGLGGAGCGAAAAAQTDEAFACLENLLSGEGMDLSDVVRTWFYNESILDWYADFNRVRNHRYSKTAFKLGALPASTAVAGLNSSGAALQLAVWATRSRDGVGAVAREVKSPLQCAASDYGSAFSRAVEIELFGRRHLFVSGTASIEPSGRTVHHGDAKAQIELSLDVVEALLRSRNFGFGDVSRAIAYCKYPSVALVLDKCLIERGLPAFPMLRMHCDICRDDLLFEIELDLVG